MSPKVIPKKIHYCWFGGNPLPELAVKCIESWKKYCPDYEIIEWNESNFDINYCDYVREAYEAKKWAFVSDVVRLYVLVNYGGIYMDTDVEVLKPLDDLLDEEALTGFDTPNQIPTGLMASQKGQPFFIKLLSYYDNVHFIKKDGSFDTTTNVKIITDIGLKHGLKPNNTLQSIEGLTLFPNEYFCPKDYYSGEIKITDNTYTIHHFSGSWLSEKDKYSKKKVLIFSKFLPKKMATLFAEFVATIKFCGYAKAFMITAKWIRGKIRGK